MNKLFLAIALAGVLLSSGCSNKSSPEKVLHSYLERMEEKDYDGAAKFATQNSQSVIIEYKKNWEKSKSASGGTPEEEIYSHVSPKWKFELGKATITGNLATIVVKTFKSTPYEVLHNARYALEKENGEWKVMAVPSPRMVPYED